MAENNYMAMLDMGLRHTEQVFGRIDEAVTKSFALQENRRQAEAELELKGTQFAAEMAFNDRQLDMEQQKNIMLAQTYKLDNEIKSKRFIEEMRLQPIKEQAARMELEVNRINRMTAFTKAKETQFSSLVGNIDAVAAGRIAEANNPELAEAYMALRSQEAASIGAGKAYNEAAFSTKVKDLLDSYKGEPVVGYNESVASPLSRISPTAAVRYSMSNPANAPSLFALENAAITGGGSGWDRYANSSLAKGYDNNRVRVLGQAREGYEAETMGIERAQDNIQKLITSRTASRSEDEKLEISKRIEEAQTELNQREANRKRIYSEAMGVEVAPDPLTPEAEAEAARKLEEDNLAAKIKKEREDAEKGLIKYAIEKKPINSFDPNAKLLERQQLVGSYTQKFEEAFAVDKEFPEGNLNFQYLYGNANIRKSSVNHVSAIAKNIASNMIDTPVTKTSGKGKSIEELVQEPEFKNIFTSLNEKPVSVSNESGLGIIDIGNRSNWQVLFKGLDWDDANPLEIESAEDFMKVVYAHSDKQYERDLFAKKLYATIVAAGVVGQMSE